MSEIAVRAYRSADRDAVRRIACLTADAGAPLTPAFPHVDFFADLLTSYYTDLEPGSSSVAVQGDDVSGYLNGCIDTRRYLSLVSRRVVPRALARSLPAGV